MDRNHAAGHRRAHHNRSAGGRQLARIAGVTLASAALAVALLSVVVQPAMPAVGQWTAVSVDRDVTLWELAVSHPVQGLSTAAMIDLIRERNSLSGTTLFVGQTVLVPALDATGQRVAAR